MKKKFVVNKKRCLAEIQQDRMNGIIHEPKISKLKGAELWAEKYRKKAENYAAKLRVGTKTELILKERLENSGIYFVFQKPFYSDTRIYIVDFFIECTDGSLYAIELDGLSHVGRESYDEGRTEYLKEAFNVEVVRFKNIDIHKHLDKVISKILSLSPVSVRQKRGIDAIIEEKPNNHPKKIKRSDIRNQKSDTSIPKVKKEGDLCRKCRTPVVKKIPKRSKEGIKTKYVYEYYLYCPKCRTMWMLPEKRILASNLNNST